LSSSLPPSLSLSLPPFSVYPSFSPSFHLSILLSIPPSLSPSLSLSLFFHPSLSLCLELVNSGWHVMNACVCLCVCMCECVCACVCELACCHPNLEMCEAVSKIGLVQCWCLFARRTLVPNTPLLV